MLAKSRTSPLVSVIVPVFNGEQFLSRCLDSIFAQTMPNFEVIVVNDGSTDGTASILADYAARHQQLVVLEQANAGQGAARNRALDLARGEFVLFVDADDFIERVTLQVTTERALEDESDLVHFDWKLYTPGVGRPGDVHYYNADPFWHKRVLTGIECDELLRVQNFYSVTKLYRRSFLDERGIRFEEGRIYEDNPFVLQAVNRAQKASLVHSPLYTIDPHPESSTRSNTATDKHVRDHLYAVRRTFELLDRRNPRAAAYLAAYHVKKIGPYYERRIPKRFRRAYVREFVQILHDANVEIPDGTSTNAPTRMAIRLEMFERNRAALFQAMVATKNKVMPRYKQAKRLAKRVKHRWSKNGAWSAELERALALPIMPNTMTFLGLDFKYTGNSRYLFEDVIDDPRFADCEIRFVTADERVAPEYRLDPAARETYAYLARTQLLLAESWIPPRVRKHQDSTWVQLWHGTPIKRMLFDSHEPRIISQKPLHKVRKYEDTLRWDYLLVDSPFAASKFHTAFLFPPERMLNFAYPRVDRLLRAKTNATDVRGRQGVRAELGCDRSSRQKVVLYAPTWRDADYGRALGEKVPDGSFDISELAGVLGPDYLVVVHNHGYLAKHTTGPRSGGIDASKAEIQELLLAADALVTDFSSVVFDAEALGLPVVLATAQRQEYDRDRGLYRDIWSALQYPKLDGTLEIATALQGGFHRTRKNPRYTSSLVDELHRAIVSRHHRSDRVIFYRNSMERDPTR